MFLIAFFKVEVIDFCPTTVSNVAGRYFLAETIKFSILKFVWFFSEVKISKLFDVERNLFNQFLTVPDFWF